MSKQVPQLKFWKTLWWSYRYPLRNWRHLIRVGWILGIIVIFAMTLIPVLAVVGVQLTPLLLLPGAIVFGAFVSSFAVAWHRTIILGEVNRGAPKFGKAELIYFGYWVGFWLMSQGADRIAGSIRFISGPSAMIDSVEPAIEWIIFVALWVLFSFAAFMLPATSVGEHRPTFGTIWNTLRYNRLRYLAVMVFAQFGSGLLLGIVVLMEARLTIGALEAFGIHIFDTYNPPWLVIALVPGALVTAAVFLFAAASAISVLTFAYGGLKRREFHDRVDLFR